MAIKIYSSGGVIMANRKPKEKDDIDRMLECIDFHGMTADEVTGQDGLLKQLSSRILEKMLQAEMDEHLGYEKNSNAGDNSGDSRNGYSEKTVITGDDRKLDIQVPRDRNGTYEPIAVPKYEKRLPLFNDQIISMYAFGMTCRDIQSHLKQVYGVDVSPELITRVTDSVMEDVKDWQSRPLEKSYPILYLDALRINSRQDGKTQNKALYVALAVNFEGRKEVLGLWLAENEGAKFWMSVLTEAQEPGCRGHPHRLYGRTHRISRCGQSRLSEHPCAAVHRPYDTELHKVRLVQGPERSMRRSQGSLFRPDRSIRT